MTLKLFNREILFNNLDMLRNSRRLRKGEFNELLGISNAYRTDYDSIGAQLLKGIQDNFPGINEEWLLTLHDVKTELPLLVKKYGTYSEGQTRQDDIMPANGDSMNMVMESLSRYLSPNKSSLSDLPPETQDAIRYAIKAYEILSSGTGYANALRENITWFRRAVENEKRILHLEEDLSSLKKQLSESGIL